MTSHLLGMCPPVFTHPDWRQTAPITLPLGTLSSVIADNGPLLFEKDEVVAQQ